MSSAIVRIGMWTGKQHWHRMDRMTDRPEVAQQEVLARLIAANSRTRFGTEHNFAAIRSAADFQRHVPVQEYESLRPYIEEQRTTGATALTAEQPLFYAQTSGSTGKPKFVPVTATMLALHKVEQRIFTYLQFRACPAAFEGKALGIMGAAVEAQLESGHTVGSVSGHLYRSLPTVVRSRFVVPPDVFSIADPELKYLVILRLALANADITYLGSPNPSTFLRLLDILNGKRDLLMQSLKGGPLDDLNALDQPLRSRIAALLRRNPGRAREISGLAQLSFANVWPRIRLVTCWTGGSCGIALDVVRMSLPAQATVMELGYQSTECRGTIALSTEIGAGLPPLTHHFFEFVEQSSWDGNNPVFLGLHELEEHKRYYILFTTAAGLYRYFMNDLVEVDGFYRQTPLLRFVQKGKGVTNITGEKLYEAQVIEAVREISNRVGLAASFYVLVADEAAAAYTLFIEAHDPVQLDVREIATAVDRRLGELNIEYESKRKSERLAPLTVHWLRAGTAEEYKAVCVKAGQREMQFKPAVLQYRKDLSLSFHEHTVG